MVGGRAGIGSRMMQEVAVVGGRRERLGTSSSECSDFPVLCVGTSSSPSILRRWRQPILHAGIAHISLRGNGHKGAFLTILDSNPGSALRMKSVVVTMARPEV
jgi:hypothetical protein